MNITNATLASLNYTPEFFGSDFRFGVRQKLTAECFDSDVTNTDGVAASVDELNEVMNGKFKASWTVNGYTLSNAQLIGFTIEPGNWVQGVKYSLEILNFLSGTVGGSLGGAYFAGLQSATFTKYAHYLLDFSESFSFNTAANSRDYSHTVTYAFSKGLDAVVVSKKGGTGETGLEIAKKLANTCLKKGRPPFGFASPVLEDMYQTYGVDCKRFFTEVYDYVQNTATFTEKFTSLNEEDKSYLLSRNTSVQLLQDGIVNVSESSELDFKCGAVSAASMETDTDAEIQEAREGRLTSVYEEYKDIILASYDDPQDCTLAPLVLDDDGLVALIENNRTYNIFTEKSSYFIKATNDAEEGACRHEYKSTIAADQDWFTASEAGSFIGNDKRIELKNPGTDDTERIYPAYEKALVCWAEMWGDPQNPDTRLPAAITAMNGFNAEAQAASPQYTEDSVTYSKVKGSISYQRAFSSHPRYAINDEKVKYLDITIREKVPYERKVIEDVVDAVSIPQLDGAQILQDLQGDTLMEKSNQFKLLGTRDASLSHLMDKCLTRTEMGENFLTDAKYALTDLNDITLDLSMSWH